jgi:hypothetical protein
MAVHQKVTVYTDLWTTFLPLSLSLYFICEIIWKLVWRKRDMRRPQNIFAYESEDSLRPRQIPAWGVSCWWDSDRRWSNNTCGAPFQQQLGPEWLRHDTWVKTFCPQLRGIALFAYHILRGLTAVVENTYLNAWFVGGIIDTADVPAHTVLHNTRSFQ